MVVNKASNDPLLPVKYGINISEGGKDGYAFVMQTHGWGSWVWEIDATTSADANHTNVTFGRGGFQEARGTSAGHHPALAADLLPGVLQAPKTPRDAANFA